VTYSARKLEGARHQIGLIRGALFTLESRLVCTTQAEPGIVGALKRLYEDVAELEQYLARPTTFAAPENLPEGATLQ
jgi:hypothetical protein